jgi:hypothetical protein
MSRLRILWVVAVTLLAFPLAVRGEGEEAAGLEYSADHMRDPFRSYIVKEKPAEQQQQPDQEALEVVPMPTFTVQGVFWGGNFPQAIINNKVVKEGDTIQEAKVISISRETVRFLFANREFSIDPSSKDTKKDPQQITTLTSSSGSRKEVP